jgi:hypothetical protein
VPEQLLNGVSGKIWVNNHAHVLRPGRLVDAAFLAHALNCVDYRAFIDGTTRDKLTQGDMNGIPIQCSPLPEQRAIAAFLDRETARTDALVAPRCFRSSPRSKTSCVRLRAAENRPSEGLNGEPRIGIGLLDRQAATVYTWQAKS